MVTRIDRVKAGDFVKCQCGAVFQVATVNQAEAIPGPYLDRGSDGFLRNSHPTHLLTVVARPLEESDIEAAGVTDLEEAAWGLLANVNPWEDQSTDWQLAVVRWREKYHTKLSEGA